MGGEKEFSTPARTEETGKIGNLRIHENNGEVHFHDDAKGLKVAIPVATMHNQWDKLIGGKKDKFKYADTTNGTELRISICKVARKKQADLTDCLIEVRPLSDKAKAKTVQTGNVTPEFQQFDKFIRG